LDGFPEFSFVVHRLFHHFKLRLAQCHAYSLLRHLACPLVAAAPGSGYGDYVTLAGLPRQGVDVVARLHQARKVDFRRAKRLGHQDGVFVWRKGCMQSTILTPEQWAALPDQIQVRIVRFTAACRGFRTQPITLVTTLLDAQLYPAAELVALYLRRWRIELCLRDVKTTLGLEQLRCLSPAMVRKELLAGLIAHNLIRCVMAQAAQVYEAERQSV